jgi:hypothetical protein
MTEQDQDESADAAGERGDDCAGAIAWRNAWLKAIDDMALAFENGMDQARIVGRRHRPIARRRSKAEDSPG